MSLPGFDGDAIAAVVAVVVWTGTEAPRRAAASFQRVSERAGAGLVVLTRLVAVGATIYLWLAVWLG